MRGNEKKPTLTAEQKASQQYGIWNLEWQSIQKKKKG
jgi:hypothetical protein